MTRVWARVPVDLRVLPRVGHAGDRVKHGLGVLRAGQPQEALEATVHGESRAGAQEQILFLGRGHDSG